MSSLASVALAARPARVVSPARRASSSARSARPDAERVAAPAPSSASVGLGARRTIRSAHASRGPRGDALVVAARKGLLADTLDGEDGAKKKKKDKKKANNQPGGGAGSDSMAGSLEPAFASKKRPASSDKNWIPNLANVNADFGEKPTKALVLANGNFVLAKWDDQIFCCDCNSTAYQFPLVDGELFYGPSGPAIRVPLDGTEYDLTTGDVITWCPRNNPVRQALGALKSAAEPVPLPVYKTRVDEQGNVACNFVDKVDVRREGFAEQGRGVDRGREGRGDRAEAAGGRVGGERGERGRGRGVGGVFEQRRERPTGGAFDGHRRRPRARRRRGDFPAAQPGGVSGAGGELRAR